MMHLPWLTGLRAEGRTPQLQFVQWCVRGCGSLQRHRGGSCGARRNLGFPFDDKVWFPAERSTRQKIESAALRNVAPRVDVFPHVTRAVTASCCPDASVPERAEGINEESEGNFPSHQVFFLQQRVIR
jgi:hypothetical protein